MKETLNKWTQKEETAIWKEAIFLFDSSTLLNFYEFSQSTRQDIYKNIFPRLEDRLWITNHTEFEVMKNRERVQNKPRQMYNELKAKHYPSQYLKEYTNQYTQLRDKTKKESRHPYFDQNLFERPDMLLNDLQESLKELEVKLDSQTEAKLTDHKKDMGEDRLLSFFKVTKGYSFKDLMNIVEEGEFRYRNEIPPGYADAKNKDKIGIAKFGDLIIWKQALDLAFRFKKPVLFVVDDLKPDWCITEKDSSKILSPRIEMIKEMKDIAGVKFWSYSTSQFLHKCKDLLKFELAVDAIEDATEVTRKNMDSLATRAVYKWLIDAYSPQSIRSFQSLGEQFLPELQMQVNGRTFRIVVQYISIVSEESIFDYLKEIYQGLTNSYVEPSLPFIVFFVFSHAVSARYAHSAMIRSDFIISFSSYLDETNSLIVIGNKPVFEETI